jgi:hypothetical protein
MIGNPNLKFLARKLALHDRESQFLVTPQLGGNSYELL